MNTNIKAFLDMISHSEGTDYGPENGYNILCGSTRKRPSYFIGWKDHPRKLVEFKLKNGKVDKSSAAGKYQLMAKNFDAYRKPLHLDDKVLFPLGAFSPAAQDAITLQLIKECHALPLIDSGNFAGAVHACKSRWASFPGSSYGQNEQDIAVLEKAYINAGGEVTA